MCATDKSHFKVAQMRKMAKDLLSLDFCFGLKRTVGDAGPYKVSCYFAGTKYEAVAKMTQNLLVGRGLAPAAK